MHRKPNIFTAFARHSEGSIAIVFALSAMVLFGIVGGAIDVARAIAAKEKMQAAADAAALAAANDPFQWEFQARKVAANFFDSSKNNFTEGVEPKYFAYRNYNANSVDMTVTAVASVDTTLLKLFGKSSIEINASATASRPVNFLDVYAVIDMSASMGLAADEPNRQKMLTVTRPYHGPGCVFACHIPSPGIGFGNPTTYDLARQNNIRLRQDVMNDAFGAFVGEMMNQNDLEVKVGARRIATYGFSDNIRQLQALGTKTPEIKKSLESFPAAERINSDYVKAFQTLNTDVGTSGSGAQASPKKMVLLVTDGVSWNWQKEVGGPIDPATCDTLKQKGVIIAVLDVKYHKDEYEYVFNVQVRPFYNSVSPKLKECASNGYYFEVGDSADQQLKTAFADVAKAMKPKLGLIR